MNLLLLLEQYLFQASLFMYAEMTKILCSRECFVPTKVLELTAKADIEAWLFPGQLSVSVY